MKRFTPALFEGNSLGVGAKNLVNCCAGRTNLYGPRLTPSKPHDPRSTKNDAAL